MDISIGAVGLAVLVSVTAAVTIAAPIAPVVTPSVIAPVVASVSRPVVAPVTTSTVAIELAAIRLLVAAIEAGPTLAAVPVAAILGGLGGGADLAVPIGAALATGTVSADLGLRVLVGALRPLTLVGCGEALGPLLLDGLPIRAGSPIAAIGTLAAIPPVLTNLLSSGCGRYRYCRHQGGCRHQ